MAKPEVGNTKTVFSTTMPSYVNAKKKHSQISRLFGLPLVVMRRRGFAQSNVLVSGPRRPRRISHARSADCPLPSCHHGKGLLEELYEPSSISSQNLSAAPKPPRSLSVAGVVLQQPAEAPTMPTNVLALPAPDDDRRRVPALITSAGGRCLQLLESFQSQSDKVYVGKEKRGGKRRRCPGGMNQEKGLWERPPWIVSE